MAITAKPDASTATSAYTVTRAFYWGGEVQPIGTLLNLTKADAAPLLAANKVQEGEAKAAKPKKEPAA